MYSVCVLLESGLHESPKKDWPRQEHTLMVLNWVYKGKYEKSHVPHCAEVFHSGVPGDFKCLTQYRNISVQLQDVD